MTPLEPGLPVKSRVAHGDQFVVPDNILVFRKDVCNILDFLKGLKKFLVKKG